MIFTYVFCSSTEIIRWLQNHLISCPFKSITGIDCPGCGFQRSVIELIQGNLSKSWLLYPPTIPLLLLFISVGIFSTFPFKHKTIFQRTLFVIVGNFVLLSYLFKMIR